MTMLVIACAAAVVPAGCARARGEMFPAMDSPMRWPPPPAAARLSLIGQYAGSDDLNAGVTGWESMAEAFRGRRQPIRFVSPHAVAIANNALLAVTDTGSSAVHIVDLDRRDHIRVTGWDDERFSVPLGVTFVGERIFVTDADRGEVIELSRSGIVRGTLGSEHLGRPVGIASCRDRLFVVDGMAHDIKVFALDGTLLRTIGKRGVGPGEFNFPTHLCCRQDRLVVADSGNSRVQILKLDGTPVSMFGHKGNAAGDLSLPKGVAFDGDGHVFVGDAQFENVQVFDPAGRLLMAFGQEGTGLGSFWLPAGIWIDDLDRVWIADSGNRRVQVFQYLRKAS